MAGFLGYCVQCLDVVKGEHTTLPYRGFVADVTPGDVPHYTAPGGKPGYYPPIKGNRPEILFDLYKPFDIFPEQTEEEKARGRLVEVNNGRAAMLGIMAVLSES